VSRGGDLLPASAARPAVKAGAFFSRFGGTFGVTDARQLHLTGRFRDAYGATHLVYDQVYRGVPAFGAQVRAHLDADGRLTAVDGVFVPRLNLSTAPRLSAARAGRLAIREVVADSPEAPDGTTARVHAADLRASARLTIYRTGLIRTSPAPISWPTRSR
jgi:Zn-dependent metalloprotease